MTLNDLEQRMAVILCYLAEMGSFGAIYLTAVAVRPILSATKI